MLLESPKWKLLTRLLAGERNVLLLFDCPVMSVRVLLDSFLSQRQADTLVAFNKMFQVFPDPADYRPIACLNTVAAQGSKRFKTMFEELNEPVADRL